MYILKTCFIVCFLAVVSGCSTSLTNTISENGPFSDVKGKTYIYYFSGSPLNILSFGNGTFLSQNGEIETKSCGQYFTNDQYCIIKNHRVTWPSGLEEKDSVQFILHIINDTTLAYIKRVEFDSYSRQWDTTKLNPTYYYLKKDYRAKVSACKK